MPEDQVTSPGEDGKLLFGASDRIELVATIVMSLAAILTAWAAFQSAKWSGEQSISFARAGAARTESTRFDTLAGQQTGIDVAVFTSWLDAVNSDVANGLIETGPGIPYTPAEGTLSGFLFQRMRPEFEPAMDAWLELWTADRATAPPTPFAMEEYQLAAAQEADRLLQAADDHAEDALNHNQASDNYVLTVVAYALVLFFAGVSSKLVAQRNRLIAISLALVMFLGATVVVFSLPIHELP